MCLTLLGWLTAVPGSPGLIPGSFAASDLSQCLCKALRVAGADVPRAGTVMGDRRGKKTS